MSNTENRDSVVELINKLTPEEAKSVLINMVGESTYFRTNKIKAVPRMKFDKMLISMTRRACKAKLAARLAEKIGRNTTTAIDTAPPV